jgi:hypothetical protein
VALLVALLVSSACSSGDEGKGGDEDVIAGASKQRTMDLPPKQTETDGGIGDGVETGNLRFRIFEVRAKDRVYAMSGPGKRPVTRGNISSEYVAIDYLAKNLSGSPLTTGAKATLLDDQGNSYGQDKSIEPPSGGTDGMELGTAQTKASTMFFEVPNGVIPATLEIEASGGEASFDLLQRHMERVPPDDYLRVYHLYFNEQAYEEAYEMFDPASVQNITLGEWLSFYEPLWGKRYVSLDGLTPLSEDSDSATFQMGRTFYDADGDIVADPEINPSVIQEMVEVDGEWKLVMRDLTRHPGRRRPNLRRKAQNAPSRLRLFPRPLSRPRPPDPRPRHATTTAMISRARKRPSSTSRQETPTDSMRTATAWLVRLCRRGCESPRAWTHIREMCSFVAEGRVSAYGLEMSTPEPPGGLPAVPRSGRLHREAVLPACVRPLSPSQRGPGGWW